MKEFFKRLFGCHRYLFVDLDGTIIKTKSGRTFPINKDDYLIRYDTLEAIKKYSPDFLFIVTNQGGIENGHISYDDFISKMSKIVKEIRSYNPKMAITYRFCQSNDKNNKYRKPNPGMIDEIIEDYCCVKYQCLMVGDASGKEGQFSDSDKKCAENAGIKYMDVNDFIHEYIGKI